jgi:hypothetical protein
MPDPFDLDAELRALPIVPIDGRVEARVLRTARAVLAPSEAPRGFVAWAELLWQRALAPVLVTGTVATYLVWAVNSAGSLYR